ncbi:Qat anti-phage system TatD family nuclease QatD [Orbaceae bacterium ac157xtp]
MMDFHCHLDLYPGAKQVYTEAAKRNKFTWLVTTTPKAFIATNAVLPFFPNILITPGLHPEIAHDRSEELSILLAQIVTVPAVGEIGLDGSPRYKNYYDIQLKIFDSIVAKCAELGGRTLSIHSRKSVKDILSILRSHSGYGTAVLHWFSGTLLELHRAVEEDCWFSIGPAVFSSANGRLLAANMPKNRVVPESDGPFAKVEGKLIMPWCFFETVQYLSDVWKLPKQEVSQILENNSKELLSIIYRSKL